MPPMCQHLDTRMDAKNLDMAKKNPPSRGTSREEGMLEKI